MGRAAGQWRPPMAERSAGSQHDEQDDEPQEELMIEQESSAEPRGVPGDDASGEGPIARGRHEGRADKTLHSAGDHERGNEKPQMQTQREMARRNWRRQRKRAQAEIARRSWRRQMRQAQAKER